MAWIWWLGAALLLAVAEVLSLDLFLIMLAGGALAGALAAALGAPFWVQVVVFALTSTVLLLALRPFLLRHLRDRVPLKETNASAMVGRPGVVVARVSSQGGRVKVQGEVWTARADGAEVLEDGTGVTVVSIDGATAVVTRRLSPVERPPGAGAPPAPAL